MQLAQPTGVADIGLSPGHILGIAGVDKNNLQPVLLKDLKGRDPIDAGGFHRHRRDPTGFEPLRQIVQIMGEGPKSAYRRVREVRVHSCHMHLRSDVDCSGIWIERFELCAVARRHFGHDASLRSVAAEGLDHANPSSS